GRLGLGQVRAGEGLGGAGGVEFGGDRRRGRRRGEARVVGDIERGVAEGRRRGGRRLSREGRRRGGWHQRSGRGRRYERRCIKGGCVGRGGVGRCVAGGGEVVVDLGAHQLGRAEHGDARALAGVDGDRDGEGLGSVGGGEPDEDAGALARARDLDGGVGGVLGEERGDGGR